MSCPKCGRQLEEAAVICSGCDFIMDPSFLGDDITNVAPEAREQSKIEPDPLLSSAGYGQDDLILGDGLDEFEAFESNNTGLAREVTHARIFVGGAASNLLRPDAIPRTKSDLTPDAIEQLKLSPFERHILSLCNGYRPVGRIRKKSGISDAEVHTSLAMLADKNVIELAGYVSEDRKDRARTRRKERRRREWLGQDGKSSTGAFAPLRPAKDAADELVGIERTMMSLPPQAPVAEAPRPAAQVDAPRVPTGDVDLDALAADAAAGAESALVEHDDLLAVATAAAAEEAGELSERELLLSVAEGAVSEVADANFSLESHLDLVAAGALQADDDEGEADNSDELGFDLGETGAAPKISESIDVGSIDVGSIDVGSIDVGSIEIASFEVAPSDVVSNEIVSNDVAGRDSESIEFASAEAASVELEVADSVHASAGAAESSRSVDAAFSLEEDDELAEALMDSDEGEYVEDLPPPQPAAAASPPSLPGQAAASASPPALPGAYLDIESSEDDPEGISLDGFSLEDSSEESESILSSGPASAIRAAPSMVRPAIQPPSQAKAVLSTAPAAPVSFEMKRKARLIFEQAQKDMVEGRPSSALMNAKLACIYDPTEAEFPASLEVWQNRDAPDAPKPKELVLFEEAKDAELAGEYQRAVDLLRKALESNPRAAPIYNRLGVILATRLKQHAAASQALLQACELDPQNLAYKNNLGKILVMEEKDVDTKRQKKGFAERLLGGGEEHGVKVRTIRPKQF